MGAIGAAWLAHEQIERTGTESRFRGFAVGDIEYRTSSFECQACPTSCEISRIAVADRVIANWGGQCDMWEENNVAQGVK